jgi:anaerobic selenocysteine-containing dehydrogenase
LAPSTNIGRYKAPPAKTSAWGQIPSGIKVVRSACFSCNTACEVLVFVDKTTGKVLKVEGDPDSPVTRGVLCAKGLAAKDLVENPQRLRMPLKRTGKRGEGKWESISWDDALTIIAEKMLAYKEKYGPQGIAILEGTRRGWSRSYSRLANAFGAVNNGAAGWAQCLWPRLVENSATFGAPYLEASDCENTKCMLVWGTNPPATWPVKASEIMDARERGADLIVVDPYFSETAAKADLWLQPRPETDTALGLAMLHVIIQKNIYNTEFVEKWTTGFRALKEHIKEFTPKWGEQITRVPEKLIEEAAELYAGNHPACIVRCLAVDLDHDSLQFCRVTSLLAAITGNIDIPGGNILVSSRGEISQNTHDFIGNHILPKEDVPLRRGYDQFPFLCTDLCPVPTAHMPTLWETIITQEPYPVKAALIHGSNAAVSYSNSGRVRVALEKLDFLAVTDLFMTQTAEMADIVLPASSWLERNNVISSFQTSYNHTIAQQRAISLPEARSDVDIVIDLAKRLGLKDMFWENETAMYDYLLGPTGLTLSEFIKEKRIYAPLVFKQYEKKGFKTPSGKVEIYSSIFEKNGCDPLPTYTEPFQSPIQTPGLTKEYPLIMTSARRPFFRHSENRQNPLLREQCPLAPVRIHPETANKMGIDDGDPVIIETPTGKISANAELTEGIHPDVIQTMPGWQGQENVNCLIPWNEFSRGIGTVSMHSIMCRIKKDDSLQKQGHHSGKWNKSYNRS